MRTPTHVAHVLPAILLAAGLPGALGATSPDPAIAPTAPDLSRVTGVPSPTASAWTSFSQASMAPTLLADASDATEPPTIASPDEHIDASTTSDGSSTGKRLRTWELPAIRVEGQAASTLFEEDRIGPYGQPRWTATRRFPTTRVYVIPEGKVETEVWARGTFKREGNTEWRFLQEVEVGLPYRFQLDFYLRQDYNTETDDTLMGGQFEVRWALADWGKIWGNPTLYFEYITLEDRPDRIEPKLLFGGEIAPRWHWAANLVAELELGGEREREYELTTGLSYTVIDSVFSIGVESIFDASDTSEDRGKLNTSFVIGPSMQWRPVPNMSVNIAPLVGIGGESPYAQVWFNLGWEF